MAARNLKALASACDGLEHPAGSLRCVACVDAMGSACDGPGECKRSENGIDATHQPMCDAWMRLVGLVRGLVEARPWLAPEVTTKKQHQRTNRCHVWPSEIAPPSHRLCLACAPRAWHATRLRGTPCWCCKSRSMVGNSKPLGAGLRMPRSHYAANALHYGPRLCMLGCG